MNNAQLTWIRTHVLGLQWLSELGIIQKLIAVIDPEHSDDVSSSLNRSRIIGSIVIRVSVIFCSLSWHPGVFVWRHSRCRELCLNVAAVNELTLISDVICWVETLQRVAVPLWYYSSESRSNGPTARKGRKMSASRHSWSVRLCPVLYYIWMHFHSLYVSVVMLSVWFRHCGCVADRRLCRSC